MKKVDLVQGSLPWFEHRSKYRNASESPALMGMSSFMTKRQLKAEKRGEGKPFVGNIATDYGNKMEPIALKKVSELMGVDLEAGVWTEGEYSASLDAYGVNKDGKSVKVEIKCPFQKERSKLWKTVIKGEIPDQYYWQLVHQDMVVDTDFSFFFVYIHEDLVKLIPFQMNQGDDYDLKESWDAFEEWDPEPEFEVITDPLFEEMVLSHKKWLEQKMLVDNELKNLETAMKSISEGAVKGFGCTISIVERKGTVQYKDIPVLEHVDLDQYRKDPTEYKKITHAKD